MRRRMDQFGKVESQATKHPAVMQAAAGRCADEKWGTIALYTYGFAAG